MFILQPFHQKFGHVILVQPLAIEKTLQINEYFIASYLQFIPSYLTYCIIVWGGTVLAAIVSGELILGVNSCMHSDIWHAQEIIIEASLGTTNCVL